MAGMQGPEPPDLKILVEAANDTARTARNLLTAMLLLAVTIAATMVAATDEALFRDSAEVFPSLGVKITLSTAYALAPPIFAFIHVNAVLQLHLLGRRVRALEERLKDGAALRRQWLNLIHGFAFAQLLAGASDRSRAEWPHRLLLALLSWLAVVAIPVAVLTTAQISFVRYQSNAVTLVHQLTLAADLTVLLWFHAATWNRVARWKPAAMAGSVAAVLATAALLWLSWTQAIPPDPERLGAREVRWWEGELRDEGPFSSPWLQALWPVLTAQADLLDRACVLTGWRWTCRYLDLSGRTLINTEAKPALLEPFDPDGHAKAAWQRQMIALALPNRTFHFANFDRVQLFSADLRGIEARKSSWKEAKLRGANLDFAQMQGASLFRAQMQGAALIGAQMQGADLFGAQMQGANLRLAQMQGADLRFAQMQGADIASADFSATRLVRSNRALTTGKAKACDGMLAAEPSPSLSPSDLAHSLEQAGLDREQCDQILHRVAIGPPASCDGKPFTDAFVPASRPAYVRSLRKVACRDVDAARAIRGYSYAASLEWRTAVDEALAPPAGPNCPGLASLLAEKE